ncbi:MAG TPA: TldD/PmbA family protein [Myxococcota bacterium]|nr:TldD/PmbA family protein [Myxococcota bacterium]
MVGVLVWATLGWASDDPLIDVLSAELERARAELADERVPPYFLAAEMFDTQAVSLRAEDGALHGITRSRSRYVNVDVRVGAADLDSTHYLRSGNEAQGTDGQALPIGDDVEVLRRELWKEVDAAYRNAVQRWSKVNADRATLVAEERAWDLAPVTPRVELLPPVELALDVDRWSDLLRRTSAVLAAGGVVRDGAVSLSASAQQTRFVSTEGTAVRAARLSFMLSASLDTIADDGSELDLSTIWVAREESALPDEAELLAEVAALRDLLARLRSAPEQDPYSGPVVLSDKAAGVFFHEIFGHRVEGHRLKRVDNAQTFRSKLGTPILPSFLDVVDDPTVDMMLGVPLNGTYAFDDEGVPAQRVQLVDDGVLRGFLQSRSTVTGDDLSNGHGRRAPGRFPVTRQGNLMVTASRSVSDADLRAQLVGLARKAGLPYGLWVDRIQGGFTYTERGQPNAFNVDVLVAWRVYVDGRPDELVRGIDLIGTPLDAFSRIVAAGELHEVFNGVCGAESGWVPVSASAPALLISQMETQRKEKSQDRPPLLPAPTAGGAP